ncbi:phosphotransferase enzyme family protein [Nonomuraea sp. 3N208]|uniref:phosphotransferase enzyme family protein n=1 Tax=Nonomuraea sp. 3N208 TaxID=3457421 RepID=UPI003FD120CD
MHATPSEGRETDVEVLAGGGVNHVVRVGDTVRRPAGPWTTGVHAVLDHVAERGFRGAPRSHGIDGEGREVLDFVPGDVPGYPLPEWVLSDGTLEAVARLLREFHDATLDFPKCPKNLDYTWYWPSVAPAEVICHGDVAPYNCVFRGGRPVAFIDFDTAHPGPRVWDVAYAAYRFVPLTDPRHMALYPVPEQARRLRLFADAYGLDDAARGELTATARARLDHLVRHMHEQAAAGNEAFASHIARGDDHLYQVDIDHIARHDATFMPALTN